MSAADLFEVGDDDTVEEAWFVAASLLDMLEQTQKLGELYDFAQARERMAQLRAMAEAHRIDGTTRCKCGLSDAEHALLKRKILTFFKLQVANLKHFLA
ncbi:MAG: hypothetical protein C4292_04425 [Nitrososphaera sp.]